MTRRLFAGIVSGLLITGLGVLMWIYFNSPPPAQESGPPEVRLTDLNRIDERLIQKGHNRPFTGLAIEHYTDGKIRCKSRVSNGVLNGISEGWYDNGALQVREYFMNGTSHGLRTKWHKNGQKLSEVMIDRGMLVGTLRRWHENGVLAEEVKLTNGMANGLAFSWYPSGCVKAQVLLDDGNVAESQYWKDGEKLALQADTRF